MHIPERCLNANAGEKKSKIQNKIQKNNCVMQFCSVKPGSNEVLNNLA